MALPSNWIVFLSDNHTQKALGCYGNTAIRTPAIDSIARHGMLFENAYCASPLCCSSRAALATGRYPHQTGFSDNALVFDGSVPSWMLRARDAGHDVVSVGKLHYRSGEDDYGFSEEKLPMHILNGRGGTSSLLRAVDGERVSEGQWEFYTTDFGVGGSSYQQYDRDITRAAIEWLRARDPEDETPWVLFVSYVSAHPPFTVPQHILDLYDPAEMPLPAFHGSKERTGHPVAEYVRKIMNFGSLDDESHLREVTRHYFALVTHLDSQIGEVLGEAAALGLRNTRYVYTSDHGEALGEQGLLGKFSLCEGSARVPLVMPGPGIAADVRETTPVSGVDLFPTILDGLGMAPNPTDSDCMGVSLLQPVDPDRTVFAEYHAAGSKRGSFMVRQERFKFLYHVGAPPELFDLEADPHESRNLAAEPDHQALLQRMTDALNTICNPEEVDAWVMARQRKRAEELGGQEAILKEGSILYSPAPGQSPEMRSLREAS